MRKEEAYKIIKNATKGLKGPRAIDGETYIVLKKPVEVIYYNGESIGIEQLAKNGFLVTIGGHFLEPFLVKHTKCLEKVIKQIPEEFIK